MTTIYDPKRDRMIMFGGSISDDYYGVQDKVWALTFGDTPTWTDITPEVAGPCARRSLVSIYDPVRDRMVIFGGWDNLSNQQSSFLGDVWALSLDGTPGWTQLQPAGDAAPVGRDIPAAAYDSKRDRMVVFAGFDGVNFRNDTWFLDWGHAGDAALLAANANVQAGVAHITWDVTAATADHAAVFRRQADTPWKSVAVVHQNGAGDVVYNDATVVPGQRYEYLAAVPSEQGTNFGGEIWVDVPSTVGVVPSLAFSLSAPNPVVRGNLMVTFSLPTAAKATLSLRDVRGRVVASQEVGALGEGGHSIAFARDSRLTAGMYFLTLDQGERSATRRLVLL